MSKLNKWYKFIDIKYGIVVFKVIKEINQDYDKYTINRSWPWNHSNINFSKGSKVDLDSVYLGNNDKIIKILYGN